MILKFSIAQIPVFCRLLEHFEFYDDRQNKETVLSILDKLKGCSTRSERTIYHLLPVYLRESADINKILISGGVIEVKEFENGIMYTVGYF